MARDESLHGGVRPRGLLAPHPHLALPELDPDGERMLRQPRRQRGQALTVAGAPGGVGCQELIIERLRGDIGRPSGLGL
ncbi:MAG: hypothetical protein ACOVK7_05025 [Burkholderiaceae bacterium]